MFLAQINQSENLPSLDQMTDILDIEGIQSAPVSSQWWLWILGILISLLIGAWIYSLVKKKLSAKKEEILTPVQKIQRGLETLEVMKFLEREETEKYYFFVSDLFRVYLEGRFDFEALEKTNQEILRDYGQIPSLTPREKGIIEEFFRYGDRIKFSDFKPSVNDVKIYRQHLEDFVSLTQSMDEGSVSSKNLIL